MITLHSHSTAPLSAGFSRQEYWNGLPFPSPADLPNPGKPVRLMIASFIDRQAVVQGDTDFLSLGSSQLYRKPFPSIFHWTESARTVRKRKLILF